MTNWVLRSDSCLVDSTMRLIAGKEFFTATMIDTCLATLVENASQPSRYVGDVFHVKCERFEGLIAAPTQLTSMTM
jgi:hypothetical protein